MEEKLPASTVVQKIGAGILPIHVTSEGADYRIVMTQRPPEFSPPLSSDCRDTILNALGLDPGDLDHRTAVQVVSAGQSRSAYWSALDCEAQPDFAGLASLSRISAEIRCNGYYLFVITNDIPMVAHARMFAPAIGISEDPVTGNGAGPLGAYIVAHRLTATNAEAFRLVVR